MVGRVQGRWRTLHCLRVGALLKSGCMVGYVQGDGFIATEEGNDEDEEGEDEATRRRKKKKRHQKRVLALDEEDYDLLEENQVKVRQDHVEWDTRTQDVCSLVGMPVRALCGQLSAACGCSRVLLPGRWVLQVKRPTGRKRLKRAEDEGQPTHRDAEEMRRDLFGNEGAPSLCACLRGACACLATRMRPACVRACMLAWCMRMFAAHVCLGMRCQRGKQVTGVHTRGLQRLEGERGDKGNCYRG